MDELISREAAIKKLKYRYPGVGVDGSKERLRFLQYIADVEVIKEVPSAEPKKGKWLPDEWGFWKCSACGLPSEALAANALYKYCPFCGAKMEGEEDD